jgi:hypothetical protein
MNLSIEQVYFCKVVMMGEQDAFSKYCYARDLTPHTLITTGTFGVSAPLDLSSFVSVYGHKDIKAKVVEWIRFEQNREYETMLRRAGNMDVDGENDIIERRHFFAPDAVVDVAPAAVPAAVPAVPAASQNAFAMLGGQRRFV